MGEAGSRIWAIWTHHYYGDPEGPGSGNTLYILRLVIENEVAMSNDPSGCDTMAFDVERQYSQV